MTVQQRARLEHLGQTGLRIDIGDLTVLVDPYLSNSVQELDSPDLVRQVPIPYQPEDLITVDWVLITHDHMDHCDPHTLPALAASSPQARFLGPLSVGKKLEQWGINADRIEPIPLEKLHLGEGLHVITVPAAHPEVHVDQDGKFHAVGYVFERNGRRLYLAGDTAVCEELLISLKTLGKINAALLPVNEDNFFRRRRGIIGNMSLREAFGLAEEVGIENVAAVHWDMFSINSASPAEIAAVHESHPWPFELCEVHEIIL